MSRELRFDPRCHAFHSFAVLLCLLQWIAYPLVKLETWHRVLVVCLLLEKCSGVMHPLQHQLRAVGVVTGFVSLCSRRVDCTGHVFGAA